MHHANAFSSHKVPRWEGIFRSHSGHKRGLEIICSAMPYKQLLNCYFHKQILKTNNLVKRFLKVSLRKAHCLDNLRQGVLTRQRCWKKYGRAFSTYYWWPGLLVLSQVYLRGLLNHDHWALPEFLIRLLSVRIKYCISIKFPSNVDAAGPETTFWKPLT